nr:hypothetical protein BaRGS_013904 [Batillaria attramentaria]
MEELQTLPDKHLVPEIEEEEVKMVFRHLQPRKASGPDDVGGRVLQSCGDQLAPFLVGRTQSVRVADILSSTVSTSVGTPQGSVISPFLYVLFTNDCSSSGENQFTIKFADDTALVDLTNSDSEYQQEVDRPLFTPF